MLDKKSYSVTKEVVDKAELDKKIEVVKMVEGEHYFITDDLDMCDMYVAVREGMKVTFLALWLRGDVYLSDGEHMLLIYDNKITIEVNEDVLKEMKDDDERSYHVPKETELKDVTLIKVYLYAT